MAVDERHRRIRRRLEEILGTEEANTLIEELGSPRFETELIRKDLQLLEARMDTRLASLEARLHDRANEQTKTLFRTFLVTNSVMVLAVASLAFGAARLG